MGVRYVTGCVVQVASTGDSGMISLVDAWRPLDGRGTSCCPAFASCGSAPGLDPLQHGPRELTRGKGWRPAEGRSAALGRESLEREGPRKLCWVGCNGNVQSTFGLRRIRIRIRSRLLGCSRPQCCVFARASFWPRSSRAAGRWHAARETGAAVIRIIWSRESLFSTRERRRQDDKGERRRE